MRFLAALILLSLAPALAMAQEGGWNLYGADGSYQGSISREQDGTLDRYGADGRYQGRYDRGDDGRLPHTRSDASHSTISASRTASLYKRCPSVAPPRPSK